MRKLLLVKVWNGRKWKYVSLVDGTYYLVKKADQASVFSSDIDVEEKLKDLLPNRLLKLEKVNKL